MLTILCTNQLQAQQVNFNGGDEAVDFLDELYAQQESVLSTLWDSKSMVEMKFCEHKEKVTAFHVTSLGFSIPKETNKLQLVNWVQTI